MQHPKNIKQTTSFILPSSSSNEKVGKVANKPYHSQVCQIKIKKLNFPVGKLVKIVSRMNDMAITISDGQFNTRKNTLLMSKYNSSSRQKWVIMSTGPNYIFESISTSLVFDAEGQSSDIYSYIIGYKPNSQLNQQWIIQQYENGFMVKNVHSNLVMEIEGGIDAQGLGLVQNKPYKYLSQLWKFEQV